jgi:hypothetical protein
MDVENAHAFDGLLASKGLESLAVILIQILQRNFYCFSTKSVSTLLLKFLENIELF